MTDRAEVVAKVTEIVCELTAVSPAPDVVLHGHENLDSLDLADIAIAVEDEFFTIHDGPVLDPEPDWTVDKIADLVMAALAKKEAATTQA